MLGRLPPKLERPELGRVKLPPRRVPELERGMAFARDLLEPGRLADAGRPTVPVRAGFERARVTTLLRGVEVGTLRVSVEPFPARLAGARRAADVGGRRTTVVRDCAGRARWTLPGRDTLVPPRVTVEVRAFGVRTAVEVRTLGVRDIADVRVGGVRGIVEVRTGGLRVTVGVRVFCVRMTVVVLPLGRPRVPRLGGRGAGAARTLVGLRGTPRRTGTG